MEIILFNLENDQDLVLAHRRSMQLAEMCGLGLVAQTSFATAVSEVVRFMIEHGSNSVLSLSLNKYKAKPLMICASIKSPALARLNLANENFNYARKLAGYFDITDTEVSIRVEPPRSVNLTQSLIEKCRQAFRSSQAISPYEEVKRKNIELQQLADNLVESENRYQELTGSLPLMMFTLAADHQIVYANRWFLNFTGKTLTTLEDTNWLDWVRIHHLSVDIEQLQLKLATHLPFQLEVNLSDTTGKVWHLLSMTPQLDSSGHVIQWFGFIVNIAAQKMVEQTLRDNQELRQVRQEMEIRQKQLDDTITELNRSNQELARYAFVASHDLQEPIRKVRLLTDLIIEKFGDTVPQEATDLLSRLKISSERMHLVVKDLLDYSRINSGPVPLNETVELSTIIELAKANLEYLINEKAAVIVADHSFPITCNAAQLMLLFQNLLANAIKFTAKGVTPAIEIKASRLSKQQSDQFDLDKSQQWIHIQVIDNGIGFEQQYSEKIFEVFQRLHSQKQYEGTGIGLSICKKIVALHGGTISASSSPGSGSIFTLFLPAGDAL